MAHIPSQHYITRRAFLRAAMRAGLGAGIIAASERWPTPVSATSRHQNGIILTVDNSPVRAGRVALARVQAPENATAVRAIFQGRMSHFYWHEDRYIGFVTADMDTDPGSYPLQIWVDFDDGALQVFDETLAVTFGEFANVPVNLPASLTPLLDIEVENAEMAQLFNIMDRYTPERFWEPNGFIIPTPGPQIGYFGSWRLYNGTYWRRHTGLDVSVPIGTPVNAIANGRVMLTEDMAIRGGYVLLDHGWGVYSGYAHLSEKAVVPGQWVRQSDVIALSGLNGRSAGAHLHWEIAVSGAWAQPEDFMTLPIFNQPT